MSGDFFILYLSFHFSILSSPLIICHRSTADRDTTFCSGTFHNRPIPALIKQLTTHHFLVGFRVRVWLNEESHPPKRKSRVGEYLYSSKSRYITCSNLPITANKKSQSEKEIFMHGQYYSLKSFSFIVFALSGDENARSLPCLGQVVK